MRPIQYGKAFFAQGIRVGDVYRKWTLNDTFIEGVDESVRYTFRHNKTTHIHNNMNDLAFQEQSFLAIHNESRKKS